MRRNKLRNWIFALLKLLPFIPIMAIIVSFQNFEHNDDDSIVIKNYEYSLPIKQVAPGFTSSNVNDISVNPYTNGLYSAAIFDNIYETNPSGLGSYISYTTFQSFYVNFSYPSFNENINPSTFYLLRYYLFVKDLYECRYNFYCQEHTSGGDLDIEIHYPTNMQRVSYMPVYYTIMPEIHYSTNEVVPVDFVFSTKSDYYRNEQHFLESFVQSTYNQSFAVIGFQIFDLNYTYNDINSTNVLTYYYSFINSMEVNINNTATGGYFYVPNNTYIGGWSANSSTRAVSGRYDYLITTMYSFCNDYLNMINYGAFGNFVKWFSVTFTNGVVEPIFLIVFDFIVYELFVDLALLLFSVLTFMIDFAFKCLDKFYGKAD